MRPDPIPSPCPQWRTRLPGAAALALGAGLALGLAAAGPAAATYAQGEEIVVQGVAADTAGAPLPELRVVLEASRNAFSFSRLGRARRDTRRVAVLTDHRGRYELTWPWDDYYNHFELALGLDVRDGDGVSFRELERFDVSSRIQDGSPVNVPFSVVDTVEVRALREFESKLEDDAARQVYEQMGKPERVDELELATHEEVTWWYFRSGKAYRFEDGELAQVIHFEPVRPF